MSRRAPPLRADDDDEEEGGSPATHLGDEEYEEFVRREFDASGRLRGGPPVLVVVLGLTLLVLAIAVLVLR